MKVLNFDMTWMGSMDVQHRTERFSSAVSTSQFSTEGTRVYLLDNLSCGVTQSAWPPLLSSTALRTEKQNDVIPSDLCWKMPDD